MHLADIPEQQIRQAFTTNDVEATSKRVFRALTERTWKCLRRQVPPRGVAITGERACELIPVAIKNAEEWVHNRAKSWSRLQWLWMLRRVPPEIWEGELATTYGYDSLLAEILTGNLRERPGTLVESGGEIGYRLTNDTVISLAEVCEAVRYISDMHRVYRWAAKGAEIEFHPERSPIEHCDSALRESVQLYDSRIDQMRLPTNRLGTGVGGQVQFEFSDKEDLIGTLAVRPHEVPVPKELLGPAIDARMSDNPTLLARFIPYPMNSDEFLSHGEIRSRHDIAILVLLRAAAALVQRHRARFQPIFARGYLVYHRASFRETIAVTGRLMRSR